MIETSGEWREERLYVLRELERLDGDVREQNAAAAVLKASDEKKQLDLNQAHARIRSLQSVNKMARLKVWATAGAASFLGVVVIELLKILWKR